MAFAYILFIVLSASPFVIATFLMLKRDKLLD